MQDPSHTLFDKQFYQQRKDDPLQSRNTKKNNARKAQKTRLVPTKVLPNMKAGFIESKRGRMEMKIG